MDAPVRAEPSLRLRELPLTAHTIAPSRLVPGDRDVDEALEEVALDLRGGTPLVFELLVRREVLAGTDQPKSLIEAHARSIGGSCSEWYVHVVATILLAGVDLFFRGKLEGLLPDHHLVTTDSIDAPDLVIADIARIDPDEVVNAWPDVPILGFTNHTDKSGLQRAHTAGFDQVIVKSALVERCGDLVAELTAPPA